MVLVGSSGCGKSTTNEMPVKMCELAFVKDVIAALPVPEQDVALGRGS